LSNCRESAKYQSIEPAQLYRVCKESATPTAIAHKIAPFGHVLEKDRAA